METLILSLRLLSEWICRCLQVPTLQGVSVRKSLNTENVYVIFFTLMKNLCATYVLFAITCMQCS